MEDYDVMTCFFASSADDDDDDDDDDDVMMMMMMMFYVWCWIFAVFFFQGFVEFQTRMEPWVWNGVRMIDFW